MNDAETQAFSDLNLKVDSLNGVVDQVLAALVDVKTKLDAAIAAADVQGIVDAATAVASKLEAETSKAKAALDALSPPPAA